MKQSMMFVMALLLGVGPLGAQELKVADDSSSGTYQQFVKEIIGVCGDILQITEVPGKGGAIGNLDRLIGNETNAALMHSDVIYFRAKSDPNLQKNFKTLVALFSEDVHFLVRNKPYKPAGSWKDQFSSGKNIDTLADLKGLTVGAAGGGYVTTGVINLLGEVGYTTQKYDSGKDVLAALDRGEIAAAEFTGAAPLPNLKDLGPAYKLLPINDVIASKLKSVYHPTTITYTSMSPDSVSTVAADALLVTREYKTPKFINALRKFRQCFTAKLDELKETPGYHKAWQQVDANNHGQWEYLTFPKQ